MRKGLAVILILIMASSQFGRMVSYVHCKLENLAVTNGKPSCDCEIIFPPAKEGDHDLAATVNIKTITVEEYLIPSPGDLKDSKLNILEIRNGFPGINRILEGTPQDLLRPPQA